MSSNMNHFIWPTQFACTVITENIILPNSYSLNVGVDPTTTRGNVNLGFKKLRYFIENQLHNSIFVYKDNNLVRNIINIENNKVIFPEEPHDFLVGTVLFVKLSAITNKYFDIDYITIDSTTGDHIQFTITDPAEAGVDVDSERWWTQDSPYTGVNSNINWEELNLQDSGKFSPTIIEGGLTK